MREIAVADVHDALERERRRDARREEHPGRVARAERTQTREEDTKEEREEEHQGSSCPPRRAVEDDRAQFAKRDGTLWRCPAASERSANASDHFLLVGSASNTRCSRLEKRLGALSRCGSRGAYLRPEAVRGAVALIL